MRPESPCPVCHGRPCTCPTPRPGSIATGPRSWSPPSSSRSTRSSATRAARLALLSARRSSTPSTATRTTTGSRTPSPSRFLTEETYNRLFIEDRPAGETLRAVRLAMEQPAMTSTDPMHPEQISRTVNGFADMIRAVADGALDKMHRAIERETKRRQRARHDEAFREAFANGATEYSSPDTAGIDYDEKYLPDREVSVHGKPKRVAAFLSEVDDHSAALKEIMRQDKLIAGLRTERDLLRSDKAALEAHKSDLLRFNHVLQSIIRQEQPGPDPEPRYHADLTGPSGDYVTTVTLRPGEKHTLQVRAMPNDAGPATAAEPAHDPVSPD